METVKNKRQNLFKKKKVKCKNCKFKLRITYMDLHRAWSEEDELTKYYVECPYCHKRIEISFRKVLRML